jgi:hypothetical protein
VESGIAPGDVLALSDPTRPRGEAAEKDEEKSGQPAATPGGGVGGSGAGGPGR